MARHPKPNPVETDSYRHENETRTNNPPVGLAPDGDIAETQKREYYYNPHLQPILRFDAKDTRLPPPLKDLLSIAQKRTLTAAEAQQLADALDAKPWLEWANKREEGDSFTVDPVSLFIHERLSTQAILETAKRNDIQRDLFADPQQKYRDAVQFYEHEVPWANRLILGDSLQVMDSLAHREGLAGQVQMIYVDPPYGINFRSNFQPEVFQNSVTDRDKDLTREIEQVKAYRDTWKLGIHSYLSYLRQRFVVARELLKDSGSIFVQIGDENVHRVRCLLDEMFGPENFVAEIIFKTRSNTQGKYLSMLNDFILWYAKDLQQLKFRSLYREKGLNKRFLRAEKSNGEVVSAFSRGKLVENLPEDVIFFENNGLSGGASANQPFFFQNKKYTSRGGWSVTIEGLSRLAKADRIIPLKTILNYKYYFSDSLYMKLGNLWTENLHEQNKNYVVQTSKTVIQRCMLMSTDPGDLVLDPTCGSGTTAYVAEQWGRRWIAIDTSRVAITLARTRILTANFQYYKLKDESEGVSGGFAIETTPHIERNYIAYNVALDPIFEKHEPILAEKLATLNAALKKVTPALRKQLRLKLAEKKKRDVTDADQRRWNLPETAWEEWEVPFDTDAAWPEALQEALVAYRRAWRAKMDEVNTCIAESAKQEVLVDRPLVNKSRMRVSGPFTVESVHPAAESLDGEAGGADSELDVEPANAAAYLEQMYALLKTGGVDFENEKKGFARLDLLQGGSLHAEGQFESDERDICVVFGPQHGPVTALQVEHCLTEARKYYDVLLFAGFNFEAEALAILQDEHPKLQTHFVQIAPDVTMGDLLKQTQSDKLFAVIGAPRTVVEQTDDGEWLVKMEGLDTYNPVDNTIEPTQADQVAAWLLDTDYDGRTFCPTQSFFPNKNAWKNIARSLKTVIDAENLEAFSGTESIPFSAGEHNRIAVKVIDRRGNELMRVHKLEEQQHE